MRSRKSTHLCFDLNTRMKVLLLIFGLAGCALAEISDNTTELETPLIYFNPWTKQPLPPKNGTGDPVKIQRVSFGPLPCSCQDLICGCCGGIKLALFNFERTACMNLSYDPFEFAIELNMLMNDESVFRRSVSAKNPPPACMPIPTTLPILPNVDFCIRLYNIFTPTPGYNLHACVNFETRIQRAPVLVLEFDCLRMGSAGLAILKPEDNGGVITTAEPSQEFGDIYDEVHFEQDKNATATSTQMPTKVQSQQDKMNFTTSTLTPATVQPQQDRNATATSTQTPTTVQSQQDKTDFPTSTLTPATPVQPQQDKISSSTSTTEPAKFQPEQDEMKGSSKNTPAPTEI